jgi:hypothetical protein
VSWDDVGNAIQASIVQASGLPANQVIWKGQDANAPGLDYIAIDLGGPIQLGIDYLAQDFDETRPRGQEFRLTVTGTREVPLEIEVFTASAVTGRKQSALYLCTKLLAALVLPSVRELLAAQDVVPFDPGQPNWIPDVPSTKFRGRAAATVRCYMPCPTVEEYVGYIERVTGIVSALDAGGVVLTRPFDTDASG